MNFLRRFGDWRLRGLAATVSLATMLTAAEAPAPGKSYTLIEPRLELLWVEPGSFLMGSPADEAGRNPAEGPQTQVTLSRGFWLGRTELTQAQYQAVTGTNPSRFTAAGPEAPVERVSWLEAMAFCAKLTERERAAGRLPEGYAYTLPTEAQWEYACRAGTVGATAGRLEAAQVASSTPAGYFGSEIELASSHASSKIVDM